MSPRPTTDVLVIGSLNHDVVVRVPRRPSPGETITGGRSSSSSGGKGGNQAVAAAAAGAATALLGAVGDDDGGRAQLADLGGRGVDTSLVAVRRDVPSSTAVIVVDATGENSIVVCSGANETVTPELVRTAPPAAVVLAQSELGGPVVDAAAELARSTGARLVLSCGPVVALAAATLQRSDPVVVNRHEAADLVRGGRVSVPADPEELAAVLLAITGARSVCVTLGAGGHVTADRQHVQRVAGEVPTTVVDTTGAGDAFAGTMAAALARGTSLTDAALEGAAAGARAVGHAGARAPRED